MDEPIAIKTDVPAVAPEEAAKVPAVTMEDLEAKVLALEEEKNRLNEETANYKKAFLKEKKKKGESFDEGEDEDAEDKMRRIAREALAESRLGEIARELSAISVRALKENKELKLANMNRPPTNPTATGVHTEGPVVKDTMVTPEQATYFKNVMKWSDQDIERYKKNQQRNAK
jgi:hypothetical protein